MSSFAFDSEEPLTTMPLTKSKSRKMKYDIQEELLLTEHTCLNDSIASYEEFMMTSSKGRTSFVSNTMLH